MPKGDLLAILDMAVSVFGRLDEDIDIKADNGRKTKMIDLAQGRLVCK